MASDRNRSESEERQTQAEQRYKEFAKENRAWDRRVKKSIDRIGETAKKVRRARRTAA